ncbi:CorA family divalent cation transporter [Mesorhizobium sp. 1B3]|uniref:CorA family divalent cation transporter n=1 Tax=Mesorhizobium sp. 1B3 TaxID=3243599 RepID=UPI003D98357B
MANTILPRASSLSPATDLDRVWIRLRADDAEGIARIRDAHGLEFTDTLQGVGEDDDAIYLSVTLVIAAQDEFRQETVAFALNGNVVVTVESPDGFKPFDVARARFKRHPGHARSSAAAMRLLLQVMNDAAAQSIELVSVSLEAMNDQIGRITSGLSENGREIGVSDISDTMLELNEREELVSRCQEAQLLLARAARYLRMEADASDIELRQLIDTLIFDIDGVKQHASFEHEKVRYLQQSVMTSLNVKQNQIVKVFTIITAVFLPPTLVATFYGMNFSVMPELAWKHGFTATIIQTLLAALLPLLYIKRKGWLR